MISAPNYLDVYTARRLSNIFLIRDKLFERKTEVALVQRWERGNGESQQTDVPFTSPPLPLDGSPCQDGCLSSRPAGLDPGHTARHHFSKSNLKNESSDPGIIPHPLFLSSSQHLSLSVFHVSFIFPMWATRRMVRGASSFKFL